MFTGFFWPSNRDRIFSFHIATDARNRFRNAKSIKGADEATISHWITDWRQWVGTPKKIATDLGLRLRGSSRRASSSIYGSVMIFDPAHGRYQIEMDERNGRIVKKSYDAEIPT